MEKLLYELKPYGLLIAGLIGILIGYEIKLGNICSVILMLVAAIILRLRYENRRK